MTVYIYGLDEERKVLCGSKANVYDRLARVIAGNLFKDLTVTDEVDNLVLNTMGDFVDRIDSSIKEEFMKVLVPYQIGDKEITEVEFDEED